MTRTRLLTDDAYNDLLEAQGHACAICGAEPADRRLAIDHDHDTNAVRGLLCTRCNVALGLLRDDPTLAHRAAAYLEQGGVQVLPEQPWMHDECERCTAIVPPCAIEPDGPRHVTAGYACSCGHTWTCWWSAARQVVGIIPTQPSVPHPAPPCPSDQGQGQSESAPCPLSTGARSDTECAAARGPETTTQKGTVKGTVNTTQEDTRA